MHRGRESAKKSGQRTKAGQSSAPPCWCPVSTLCVAGAGSSPGTNPCSALPASPDPTRGQWDLALRPAQERGLCLGIARGAKHHGHQLCAHQCHHTVLAEGLASAGEREPEPVPASSFQESCECHVCHLQLLAVTPAQPWPSVTSAGLSSNPALPVLCACRGSWQSPQHPAATDALSS